MSARGDTGLQIPKMAELQQAWPRVHQQLTPWSTGRRRAEPYFIEAPPHCVNIAADLKIKCTSGSCWVFLPHGTTEVVSSFFYLPVSPVTATGPHTVAISPAELGQDHIPAAFIGCWGVFMEKRPSCHPAYFSLCIPIAKVTLLM